MELFFSQILDGLSIASVLLLAATGLAIVFGLMGVINLAHGELMMLGAYVTFVVQNLFKPLGPAIFELYYPVALILAFIITAMVGVLLERTLIRKLYGRPLETLLATWGVSLVLIQLIRSISTSMLIGILAAVAIGLIGSKFMAKKIGDKPYFTYLNGLMWAFSLGIGLIVVNSMSSVRQLSSPWFGPRNLDVSPPKWLQGSWGKIGTVELPGIRVFIILLSIFLLIGVLWFLSKSAWGLRIRAVTQNRQMSNCLGIPTDRVDSITFGLGSGLAGVAGAAITLLGSVGPNLGTAYIVSCFMVIVLGGVGNLLGTVLASIMLGIIQSVVGSGSILIVFPNLPPALKGVVEFFATTSMSLVLVFIFIIVFLQFKPNGMFPQKGRSVDA
ncbi:branched-chain amino acid ABC transporter permease [Synechococcus sp. CS-602]|uniref:ABC transporter permease subunit n=1 Tax=Synechococcaceae TaxID=1890426 RepID=UPI0008FF4463|nr:MULTISPECIES: branched-chain amino acid ABC transporter permease [Synechococcaceae]MCT4365203.1 branched-chain amino acid ABC transporter permease [Candidatus Regnicoccus frigidus MAG-AL1]APD48037.1 branched-chain amino acid ABC transporter permease [Synechococcus sp. SynAce01]MCT0203080.1 branched-chain amino acid ABC transporter permease [Synechococcus sp. CS-603]MCT0204716.1 branched-chain amino acid ABC transporter permease [Synechococcus sp. CS-602]MCT0246138.1 branched-chain amino aci